MNRTQTYGVTLVMSFVLLACGFALAQSQSVRLPSGSQIVFLVPPDVQLLSGAGGDMIIVTGRSVGLLALGGTCENETVQVQSVTVVDPGDSRATRITNEFLVLVMKTNGVEDRSDLPPLSAGSRFTEIQPQGDCTDANGRVWNKFLAVAD